MAFGARVSIPLLKLKFSSFFKNYRALLFFYICSFILIEGLFVVFLNNQGMKASQSIEAILRNDLNLDSYYQIGRTLSDLEDVGFISCAKLQNENLKHLVPYDTQYKNGCNPNVFKSKILKAVDGQNWILFYEPKVDKWMSASHFLIQISVCILFLFIWMNIKRKEDLLNLKITEEKIKNEIANQVAHDIRSPLSALSMVAGSLSEISEDKRILIRNATQRINDIANDLLHKGKSIEGDIPEAVVHNETTEILNHTIEFIPALVDILISEKRMQFRENSELEIEIDLSDSFGAFAKVNGNEVKRVLSNLINNSVESFKDQPGKVIVGVKKYHQENKSLIEIFVKDNGIGIPQNVLAKLGQMGVTHGKEGSQSGSGLGVYHAKKTVEAFGGTLQIESTEGQGTMIRVLLPMVDSPTWFANKLDLTGKKYLVSLDDDTSIHQIWSARLNRLGVHELEHIRFQSGEAFERYVNSNINKIKQTLFLVDYELLNETRTGLDIIEELVIEKSSVLVTSRYEEKSIQDRALKIKLPILPKSLAGFVPFEK